MALRPTTADWNEILDYPYYGLFETGTHEGTFARLAKFHFKEVLTVENNEYYYRNAYEERTGVKYIFGDSVEQLKEHLPLEGRWVFYLDAHYFIDPKRKLSETPFPLFKEIEIITSNQAEWLIIVDDVHNFGKKAVQPDWKEVTEESLGKYGKTRIYKDVCVIYQDIK